VLEALSYLSYIVVKLAFRCLFRLYFGARILGTVPRRGPVIVAPNHASFLDALILGSLCPRRVRFVMTDMYVSNPLVRWFCRWGRVIYVKEGRFNRTMLLAAGSALDRGECVGLFPEGGISTDGRLRRVQAGIISLAARTEVVIIPTAIRGTYRAMPRGRWLPKPSRVEIRFGKPFVVHQQEAEDRAGLRREADRLQAAIADLLGDESVGPNEPGGD